MDNVYEVFPTLKSRVDMLKPKKYIYIYVDNDAHKFAFDLSNDAYNFDYTILSKFDVIKAYRKSGKIISFLKKN